jgi:hypothetical protein
VSTSTQPAKRRRRSPSPEPSAVLGVMSFEDSVLVSLGDEREPTAWAVLNAQETRELALQLQNAAALASEFSP